MSNNGRSRKGKAPIDSSRRTPYGGPADHQHHQQQSGPAVMNELQHKDPFRTGTRLSLSDAPSSSVYQTSRKRQAEDMKRHSQTEEQYQEKRQHTSDAFGLDYGGGAYATLGIHARPSSHPAADPFRETDASLYGYRNNDFQDPFALFPAGQIKQDIYHSRYMGVLPNFYKAAEQVQDFGPQQIASGAHMSYSAAGGYAANSFQQYQNGPPQNTFLTSPGLDKDVISPVASFPTRWPNPSPVYNQAIVDPLQYMTWPEGDLTPCNEHMVMLRLQHADLDDVPYSMADYPVVEEMVIAEQAWGLDSLLQLFLPRKLWTSRVKHMLRNKSKPGYYIKPTVQWSKKQPQWRISFWDSDHMVEMLRPLAATKRNLSLFDIVMLKRHVESCIAAGARNEEELALPLPPSLVAPAPAGKKKAKNAEEQDKWKQMSKRDFRQPDVQIHQAQRQADCSAIGVNRRLRQENFGTFGGEALEWPQNELLLQQPVVPFSSSPVSSYLPTGVEALPNQQGNKDLRQEPAQDRPRHGKTFELFRDEPQPAASLMLDNAAMGMTHDISNIARGHYHRSQKRGDAIDEMLPVPVASEPPESVSAAKAPARQQQAVFEVVESVPDVKRSPLPHINSLKRKAGEDANKMIAHKQRMLDDELRLTGAGDQYGPLENEDQEFGRLFDLAGMRANDRLELPNDFHASMSVGSAVEHDSEVLPSQQDAQTSGKVENAPSKTFDEESVSRAEVHVVSTVPSALEIDSRHWFEEGTAYGDHFNSEKPMAFAGILASHSSRPETTRARDSEYFPLPEPRGFEKISQRLDSYVLHEDQIPPLLREFPKPPSGNISELARCVRFAQSDSQKRIDWRLHPTHVYKIFQKTNFHGLELLVSRHEISVSSPATKKEFDTVMAIRTAHVLFGKDPTVYVASEIPALVSYLEDDLPSAISFINKNDETKFRECAADVHRKFKERFPSYSHADLPAWRALLNKSIPNSLKAHSLRKIIQRIEGQAGTLPKFAMSTEGLMSIAPLGDDNVATWPDVNAIKLDSEDIEAFSLANGLVQGEHVDNAEPSYGQPIDLTAGDDSEVLPPYEAPPEIQQAEGRIDAASSLPQHQIEDALVPEHQSSTFVLSEDEFNRKLIDGMHYDLLRNGLPGLDCFSGSGSAGNQPLPPS
ncbi:hypothetical protein DDE82_006093 [Stemphylium lycopersici]|nr:hypothetical protein DDE82_006093 [Stemphylium lycopersici]